MIAVLMIVALALGLAAFDVYAQGAVDKGPFDPSLWMSYIWVMGIAVLGGCASFYLKVKRGQARYFNLAELVGEIVTSALAGIITFWLCKSAGVNDYLSAAFVGIAGHMGSRALFLLEKVLERWFERFGVSAPVDQRGTPGDQP